MRRNNASGLSCTYPLYLVAKKLEKICGLKHYLEERKEDGGGFGKPVGLRQGLANQSHRLSTVKLSCAHLSMCCLAVFTLHQLGNHDRDKLNDLLYGPLPKFFKRLLTPGLGKQGKFEWAEQQNTLTHRAFQPLWPSWLNHIPATSMAGWSRTISCIRRWTHGSLRNVLNVLFSHSVSPHPDQRGSCGWEVSEHKKSKSPSRSRSQPCYTHWPYS